MTKKQLCSQVHAGWRSIFKLTRNSFVAFARGSVKVRNYLIQNLSAPVKCLTGLVYIIYLFDAIGVVSRGRWGQWKRRGWKRAGEGVRRGWEYIA